MTGQQLKNSILQMAVSGKLVPQDPNDEPASVLLDRIRAEKEQLVKEGKIKKEKNPSRIFRGSDNLPYEQIGNKEPVCIADEVPFEIPESWEWCRVGDLFTNNSGLSYKKQTLSIQSDDMVRVLRGGNIGDESYVFKSDDVFISSEFVKPDLYLKKNYLITPSVSSLERIGKVALIDKDYTDVVVGGFVLMLIPIFSDDVTSKFLLYSFAAKHHRDNCRNITHKSGQAFYNLSREKLMNLPVAFPPLPEQKRIVDKIEELMPCVNEYTAKEKLSKELNDAFPDQLRKSILQYAVQGTLVPQDPNDEPASVLLDRIRAEKERLIAAGKIKRDKHESVIYRRDNSHYEKIDGVERCIDDEIQFEIPESWAWCRLGTLIKIESGKGLTAKQMKPGNIPVYGGNGITGYHDTALVTRQTVVIGRVGFHCGSVHITEDKAWITDNAFITTFPEQNIYREYLVYTFRAMDLGKSNNATAQPVVSGKKIYPMLFPLPPYREQKRIVQKIRQVFSYIDKIPLD